MWHVKLCFNFFYLFRIFCKFGKLKVKIRFFQCPAGKDESIIASAHYWVCEFSGKWGFPLRSWYFKRHLPIAPGYHQDTHPPDKPNKGSSESWMYFLRRSCIASSRRSFWRFPSWAARILIRLVNSESRVVLYIFLFPNNVILDQKGPLDE